MEEDKLKDVFDAFRPELTSDSLFLAGLRRNMEAVEIVRRRQEESRRRGRRAVLVAAVTGFAVGAILSALLPYIGEFAGRISLGAPDSGIPLIGWQSIGWGVIGLASVLTSLNAYTLALARQNPSC
ncbi:MAG: hypothetical protein K2G30_10840 [Muribaculaceae bacterium]|nr:hypothetical protein [Muribaculaceae bacterium]